MSGSDEEKEWGRVLSNPDGLIISDSLISRVDPYNLGDIENDVHVKPVCTFTFTGYRLSGDVLGFSNAEGQRTYTFSTSVKEASKLMNSAELQTFSMSVSGDEIVTLPKESIEKLNFNVDVQSANVALVTISFSEVV